MGPPQYNMPPYDMYDNRTPRGAGRGGRGGRGYMANYYGPPRPSYRGPPQHGDQQNGYAPNRRPYYKRYRGGRNKGNSDEKDQDESNHIDQVNGDIYYWVANLIFYPFILNIIVIKYAILLSYIKNSPYFFIHI